MNLSTSQKRAYDAVMAGRSVLITGPAGTGKSYLISHIIANLNPTTTAVTSSTGLSALAIKAQTLHSWASVGLAQADATVLAQRVIGNPTALTKWTKTKTLLVDEISMISASLFDKLETIARLVRPQKDKPFGGIQLICCGDFLQLKPVDKGEEGRCFAFQSLSWNRCIKEVIELDQVFRQDDNALVNVLSNIRLGVVDQKAAKVFASCRNRIFDVSDGILPTRIFALKTQVDKENKECLAKLKSEDVTFTCIATGKTPGLKEQIMSNCPVPNALTLKVGAQVMLYKNLDPTVGLVNGSSGVIVSFEPAVVHVTDSGPTAQRINLNNADQPGATVSVRIANRSWLAINPDNLFPNVKFLNGVTRLMTPEEWTIEQHDDVVARCVQVPLTLAYALTVHKCQGMTLGRVSLDMSRIWEYGQAYVALSRIRSLESLSIKDGLSAGYVRADPGALEFYNKMKQYLEDEEEKHVETTPATVAVDDAPDTPVAKRVKKTKATLPTDDKKKGGSGGEGGGAPMAATLVPPPLLKKSPVPAKKPTMLHFAGDEDMQELDIQSASKRQMTVEVSSLFFSQFAGTCMIHGEPFKVLKCQTAKNVAVGDAQKKRSRLPSDVLQCNRGCSFQVTAM